MLKHFLIVVACLCPSLSAIAQSDSPDFQKIAILPFSLLGYQNADKIALVQQNIEDAFARLQLPSEVMSATEAAAIFSIKGINKDNIHTMTFEDLSTILAVDAIVVGEVNSASNDDPLMSEIVLQLVDGHNGHIIWRAAKTVALVKEEVNNEVLMASKYNVAIPYD